MRKLFSIAVLALTLAACTSDDESISQSTVDEGVKGIPFSATISAGHATRAITENNDVLETAWADNEQVALIHNNNVYVMSVTANNDGTATISGTIEGSPEDGDDVTIVYPASAVDQTTLKVKADLLAKQDGTLATIAQSLDLRQSSGAKLKVAASSASLDGTVTLENQVAIVKFSLSDGTNDISTTKFLIKDVNGNVLTTVEPSAAASNLYVAMSPATSAFLFEAIVGSDTYSYAVSAATLSAGMYYQSPLTMKLPATYRIFTALGAFTDEVIPADAQTLTGTVTLDKLAAGTYVVEGTTTYSGNLKLAGDVNLILLDGASLTVSGMILGGDKPEDAYIYNLTIYGQELGTGTLSATGDCGILLKNLTVHGGVITATGTDVNGGDGINTQEKVTVYEGEVYGSGASSGRGINAQGGIVLGAGFMLYEDDNANPTAVAASQTNCTKRYAIIKEASTGGII